MSRVADMECAGGCGTMLWRGSGSLPEGEAKCQPCRKRDRAVLSSLGPVHGPWPANACDGCGSPTGARTCDECKASRKRARYRHKAHMRRVVSRLTDLTPSAIVRMRDSASSCPMRGCGVAMVDEPLLPHSKELDHIRPIVSGGTHIMANVRIICRSCNRARPHDGSDYEGELPPEAVDIEVAQAYVLRIAQEREAREVREPVHTRAMSAERGQRASMMRSEGMRWDDIAKALGYRAACGAYHAAKAHPHVQVL